MAVEQSNGPVPVVRVGRADRKLGAGIVAVALLLAIAIAKPWTDDGLPAAHAPDAPPSAQPSAPQPSAVAEIVSRIGTGTGALITSDSTTTCFGTLDWELVTDGRFLGRPSRTWIPVDASVAQDPLDPSIPILRVTSSSVLAMGFCAPVSTSALSGGSWGATLWRLGSSGSSRDRTFRPVARLTGASEDRGAVASPPSTVRGGASEWPPGTYVLEVHDGMSSHAETWFGVELRAPTP